MMGFDKFIWFIGVVEDNDDPTHNGRVRVRAFNVHPPKGEDVPTRHLPWATVINNSYGASQVIPSVGEWVIGFFIDGNDCQHPMLIGSLPGTNLGLPGATGLPDADEYLPPEYIKNIGKPPLSPYMGAEDGELTASPAQATAQKNGIKTAIYKNAKSDEYVRFSEPNILTPEKNYDSRVFQSKEGNNVIVLNESEDGDGSTILISHSSGSAVQIDANGTIFIKSFGDKYNSSEGFEFNRIDKDSHTNVGGDWSLMVEGGSGRIEIQGDLDISCNNFNVDARASANIFAGNAINLSGGKVGLTALADDVNIGALNQIKIQTVGIPGLKSGNIIIKAPLGDLNIDSYALNMFSHSYIGITSLGLPDILALPPLGTPNILIPPPPKLISGIEINTPTYLNVWTGLRTTFQTLGQFASTAIVSSVMQSPGSASMIGGVSANVTGGASATVFSASTNVTGVGSLSLFSAGRASLTGVGSASVFAAGKASLTGAGVAHVFGGGVASVTGGGSASLNGGVAFVGGGATLLGTSGPRATPGTPGTPGLPAVPAIPQIPIPAYVNLAEFAALVVPDPEKLDPIRPFTGYKADNRLGVVQPINITSRSPK